MSGRARGVLKQRWGEQIACPKIESGWRWFQKKLRAGLTDIEVKINLVERGHQIQLQHSTPNGIHLQLPPTHPARHD
jgi:hypothetical protein